MSEKTTDEQFWSVLQILHPYPTERLWACDKLPHLEYLFRCCNAIGVDNKWLRLLSVQQIVVHVCCVFLLGILLRLKPLFE